LAFPEDCGDAASVRLIHPVSVEAARGEQTNERKAPLRPKSVSVVVAYDSGAWCVFSLRFPFLETNAEETDSSAVVSRGLRLSLVTACPPHVAFSDAYKYRKRAPWSPSTRRPSIGAALADGRGETLFFASPVVGDNDVYAWDVAAIASASKKKEYRDDDDDDEEKTKPSPRETKKAFLSVRRPYENGAHRGSLENHRVRKPVRHATTHRQGDVPRVSGPTKHARGLRGKRQGAGRVAQT
jgi:hypothetical protein